MKTGIFGTGNVGQTIAAKLVSLGYEVMIGTRDVNEARSRTTADNYGSPGFGTWLRSNPKVKLGTYSETATFGDMIINATSGSGSLEAFKKAKPDDLKGKVVIDIANPLDFSKGMPPSLIPSLSNTNSLGEELQKEFPQARIVKTLNTMWCGLMVNPGMIGGGDHVNYLCGNDNDAKKSVKELLIKMGWKEDNLLDLGDITNSRGTESVLLIWLRLWGKMGTGAFNFKVVK